MIRPTNLHLSTIFRLWNMARSMASFVELKNITSVLVLFNFRLEIDENSSIALIIVSMLFGESVLQKTCRSSAKQVGAHYITVSFQSRSL